MPKVYIHTEDSCILDAEHFLPKSPTRGQLRAVVLVHGFAAEKTENGLFIPLREALLERGYQVLMYDWRGLGNSEGDFGSTSLQDHSRDLVSVVGWLMDVGQVDPTQICGV